MGCNRMIEESLNFVKTDWKNIIINILNEYPNLNSQLEDEEKNFDGLLKIFPPKHLIFSCFNYFNFNELKVVIIGQDPYHQLNQANGLCFSVNDNIKIPPSLKNIFKEIYEDKNININNGNLEYLAKQGVLLLNTTLTVRESSPNSHFKYWKGFTEKIVNYILEKNDKIVFLLWGGNAKKLIKENEYDNKHLILRCNHPSPLSANKGGWFNNKHFIKTNEYLDNNSLGKINFRR